MVKKLAIAFGGLVAILIVAIIVIPLVVDVDKYRPQIVGKANEYLNGKMELGKLSLSLWGQIRVEVDGLTLSDPAGRQVVAVKNAYFHLPFTSILSGSPELTFKMDQPDVNVIKYKSGKINVMGLMKPTPAEAPASHNMALPAIATRARLGIDLKDAHLTYKDELTGLDTKVDLNVIIKDLSLSRPMDLEVWSDLNLTLGKTFALKGPIRLTGKAQPVLAGQKFDHLTLSANLDGDNLEMNSPGMFEKKKGMALNGKLALTASADVAKLESLVLKFFNAEVKASGELTHLQAVGTAPANPLVNLSLESNAIDFKPWVELVPMLKDFDLGGTAQLTANVNGPANKINYKAEFKVDGLTAKAPKLKAQPRIDALVSIVTDQIDHLTMTMKAPGNELSIQGKLASFTKPHGEFQVTSSGMDLDQLVDFPPPAAAKAPAQASGDTAVGKTDAAKAPVANYDAMLDSLRKNKIAADTAINVGVNIKLLKAYNVKMTDIGGKLYFKDMVAGLDAFTMKVFNGSTKSYFAANLKPQAPTYRFGSGVDGLSLAQAVESQLALFKNTMVGTLHFDIAGEGASFNPDPAMQNLKARGNLKVAQANFTTIDVGKMVSEALNKSIEKVGEKVPQVKGKGLHSIPSGKTKYDLVSSDFTIAGGIFTAPNFVAKAAPNDGIDLRGDVTVGMKEKSLKTNWEVIDTYDLTGAKAISVDQAGVHVDHILAEGNGPIKFPIHAGCTLLAPCYSYTEVPEYFAKVALGNVTNAVAGRAKAEVQNRVQNAIKNVAPAPVQDQLNKLFH